MSDESDLTERLRPLAEVTFADPTPVSKLSPASNRRRGAGGRRPSPECFSQW